MKDVLATLAKLPPRCAAVVEGQAVFIRRGARETSPAFMGTDQVEQWNADNDVTVEHLRAMEVGAALGWDADGADPDHYLPEDENPERLLTLLVPLALEVKVRTRFDAQAAETAKNLAQTIINDATWTFEDQHWFVSIGMTADTPDIIQDEKA